MAGPESKFWQRLRKLIGSSWDAQRHEDKSAVGVPDVSFGVNGCQGWIELKGGIEKPKRYTTIVRIPHLKNEQIQWIRRRGRWGGRCFLLIEFVTESGKEYMLFDHNRVEQVGTLTYNGLSLIAKKHWLGSINPDDFLKAITT